MFLKTEGFDDVKGEKEDDEDFSVVTASDDGDDDDGTGSLSFEGMNGPLEGGSVNDWTAKGASIAIFKLSIVEDTILRFKMRGL